MRWWFEWKRDCGEWEGGDVEKNLSKKSKKYERPS
jgi:hypothetical protein